MQNGKDITKTSEIEVMEVIELPSRPKSPPIPSPKTTKPNPFILPRVENNTLYDPLRGLSGNARALIVPGNKHLILAHFQKVVTENIHTYQSYFPGRSSLPSNLALDGDRMRLGHTKPMAIKHLIKTWAHLEYRLKTLGLVERVCAYLGLELDALPPIKEVDIERFKVTKEFREKWDAEMVRYATDLVRTNKVLDEPSMEQGREFKKPIEYLGAALGRCRKEKVDEVIEQLLELKKDAEAKRGR